MMSALLAQQEGVMAHIGYARTSTVDQVAGSEAQIRDLRAAGCCERDIYREQVSSIADRPELALVLSRIVRPGDVLIVTKLDRLARSTADLLAIAERLKAAGAALKVLDSPIDMTSPTGELMLTILGAIAQFERQIMLARQREGVAKAKAEGKYRGRKPTVRAQSAEIGRLKDEGLSDAEIARRLGVHRANVGRVLKARQVAAAPK
jgi:DNA invertase Pin-like site-specific DNA recombinase